MSSSTSSLTSSSTILLNASTLSNPFFLNPVPSSPVSSTTSSSSTTTTNSSITDFNKRIFHLEKELETIKIKKICFGIVSVKELDLFLEKVARVKNELNNCVY